MSTPRAQVVYIASRPGYSLAGQVFALGWFPWALAVGLVVHDLDAIGTIIVTAVILTPAAIWLAGKWSGPRGPLSWFYRRTGRVVLDPDGVDLEAPFLRRTHLAWSSITGLRQRGVFLVLGDDAAVSVTVPGSLIVVQTADLAVETSLAVALAAYRPDRLVPTEPFRHGFPCGLRLRQETDEPFSFVGRAPTRTDQRLMVAYLVTIAAAAILRGLLFR